MAQSEIDDTSQWLNYLQPEGLVLGPNVLRNSGLTPLRQTPLDTEAAAEALGLDAKSERADDKTFVLGDPWRFFTTLLDWEAKLVAGAPGGPALPGGVSRTLPEHNTLLEPDMALLWRPGEGTPDVPAQMLVLLHPELDPDARGQFGSDEWEASPHQRLERLLRETKVGTGILIAHNALRLVYSPPGETAGWITWPLAALGRVEGRPMLAGLKLALGRNAFWTGPQQTRLRTLVTLSREAQNEVSGKLSSQVLEALYELLRGLHRAAPARVEALAANDAHHLYEGLLTCLMRLVFLLYAEDRDLLPTHKENGLGELWEQGYSIKTLYSRLLDDDALNPDTMDERRGAWGQLLAVFRVIHEGYAGWVARRGGKLFDPNAFPFLEGRDTGTGKDAVEVLFVSDGTILRILHGLMTVEGRGIDNQKVRERLSYRSLDVESIGSVYETVMGFTVRCATERTIALRDEKRLPNFIGLETLLTQEPADRQKWLKERSIKLSTKQAGGVKAAESVEALIEALANAVDERASPKATPIGPGVPYLQPTDERRRSGSHYTPRSLTEPIVRHALEPAFRRIGPNAAPEEVLSLKVLDPACGSGAFLVEACRQLGARLEQAWAMHKAERPTIPSDEDELIHARRLVAQRCLYGVDRNPTAVDLARLSLWLATLAREHEFSFLDHAIKSGDSLVGLTQHEIEAANWNTSKPSLPYIRMLVKDRLRHVAEGREAIRTAPDDVTRAIQQSRHDRVEEQLEVARDIGDSVIAAFFSSDKPKARELQRQTIESILAAPLGSDQATIRLAAMRFRDEHGWRPFHWQIEFPEVFSRENPGFDAIVGNPPFAGKITISAGSGRLYVPWLQHLHEGAHGNADLVAHFFRRAFDLLRYEGAFGLIATNTVGQGDTRATGLTALLKSGGRIYRAVRRRQWPNEGTAVVVSIVHVIKGVYGGFAILDNRPVDRISAYLMPGDLDDSPQTLATNNRTVFQGSIVLGQGFTFDDDAATKGRSEGLAMMHELVKRNPRNAERIFPYIGGDEVMTDPAQLHRRFVIDFADLPLVRAPDLKPPWVLMSEDERRGVLRSGYVPEDFPGEVAADWPDLLEIVRARVKPERDGDARPARRLRWWRFGDRQSGLYRHLSGHESAMAIVLYSPHLAISRLPARMVFSHKLGVMPYSSAGFAVLQSRLHEIWSWSFSATLGDRTLAYALTDVLGTFPFPPRYETDEALESIGGAYHSHRAQLMVDTNEGITKTYNHFHDGSDSRTSIQLLRKLHDELDLAVLRAYGWEDLAESLRPEFLTPDSENDHTYQGRYFWPAAQRELILSRLLALNAERYAQEVAAGLHEKGRKRAKDEDDEGEME